MNIGETIRNFRLQKGMSQGDIEKRTGLLRCYLSRVENGHTIPSLDTLAKIASAMDVALAQFFSDAPADNGSKNQPQVSDDILRFLNQIRRYSRLRRFAALRRA
jgi:transcriptional regulator with XRE-family HTH domain